VPACDWDSPTTLGDFHFYSTRHGRWTAFIDADRVNGPEYNPSSFSDCFSLGFGIFNGQPTGFFYSGWAVFHIEGNAVNGVSAFLDGRGENLA
jgi:hypothetical protein